MSEPNSEAELIDSKNDAPSPTQPESPGQRLKARLEAKAEQKASTRDKAIAAEVINQATASKAHDFFEVNRPRIIAGLGILVVALAVYVAYTSLGGSGDPGTAKALTLGSAAMLANVGEAPPEETDPDAVNYESRAKRAQEALKEYAKAARTGGIAGAWAALGQGRAYLELEKWADARTAYQRAATNAGHSLEINARAVEGLAFADEGEGKRAEALKRFEELGKIGGGAFRALSILHEGRVRLAMGETDKAKALLKRALEQSKNPAADLFAPRGYVETQAQLLLADLGEETAPTGGISPEMLQQYLRMQQQ